ncbi:hypothetical protein ACFWJM_01115 [Streptomyces sp. NPDC127077]|uniref:hypothetical protein n=1 Tax=Streptomyces sp. NPDC127077 TaxID=3347131 RepID=UPI0036586769
MVIRHTEPVSTYGQHGKPEHSQHGESARHPTLGLHGVRDPDDCRYDPETAVREAVTGRE